MRAILAGMLAAGVVSGWGCRPDTPAARQAARKAALEEEADDWNRKGTVLPHELSSFQAFTLEYRRAWGKEWDAEPAKKK